METLWVEITNSYANNKGTWDLAFIAFVLMGSYSGGQWLWNTERRKTETAEWDLLSLFTPRRRGRGMKRARKDYVASIVVDDFVNSVEKLVYNQQISRTEATECYRKMKQLFPIRDLFPSTELLKEAIKRRLGTHEPTPLPGSEAPKKRKHLFDKSVKA